MVEPTHKVQEFSQKSRWKGYVYILDVSFKVKINWKAIGQAILSMKAFWDTFYCVFPTRKLRFFPYT